MEQIGAGRKIEPYGSAGRATPWFAERFARILQTSSRTDVGILLVVVGVWTIWAVQWSPRINLWLNKCVQASKSEVFFRRSAPADLKKDAGGFDRPIALGLLPDSGQVAIERDGRRGRSSIRSPTLGAAGIESDRPRVR
jgi:hypothetical protein